MPSIIVTGANGYLGGHVMRILQRDGHIVIGFDSHWNVTCEAGQVSVASGIHDIPSAHTIIHLAWFAKAGSQEPDLQEECLKQFHTLIDSIAKWPEPPHVIFASTASVYGTNPTPETLYTEESPTNPTCAYTKAKIAAELILRDLLPPEKVTILRLGSLMGRGVTWGRTRVDLCANAIAMSAFQNRHVKIWYPESWKPLCHVADAAEVVGLAAARKLTGVYNVSPWCAQSLYIGRVAATLTGSALTTEESAGPIPVSCRVSNAKLEGVMRGRHWRSIEEAIREFHDYQPTPLDVNVPWGMERGLPCPK